MFNKINKRFNKCYNELNSLIEIEELEINNKIYSLYYYYETDEVFIVKWNDWFSDIDEFVIIDTKDFVSFAETRETEFATDNWNAGSESVFQTYYTMDLKEYIEEYGEKELIEIIQQNNLSILKRGGDDRIKRFITKCLTKIKRTLCTQQNL